MVRFAVSADIAGAVDREHNRQIVQADIDHHLVIRALQECRIDRHDRLHAGFGEPCCEGYRVLFSDADIERSVGIGVRKTVQPGPVDHGSGDRHDAVISFRQLNHFIAEVRGKCGLRRGFQRFSCQDIERACAVEYIRVVFRIAVSLALLRDHVQHNRSVARIGASEVR